MNADTYLQPGVTHFANIWYLHAKNESFSKTILACWSGAQVGLSHRIKNAKQSHDTATSSEAKSRGTPYDHYTVRNGNFRGCLYSDRKMNGNIFKLHLFINKKMSFLFFFPSERWQFRRFRLGSISKLCGTVVGDSYYSTRHDQLHD